MRKITKKAVKTENFNKEIALIKKDTSLREIILSGGDPLSLSNKELSYILKKLNTISHIKRIRFHSRYPLGIPQRIDKAFIKLLSEIVLIL